MKKIILPTLAVIFTLSAFAQPKPPPPQEPVAPDSQWLVNDRKRPVPEQVLPGDMPLLAPDDADIIFDGQDMDALETSKGEPCNWVIEKGELVTTKGTIRTKKAYGSVQLHAEYFIAEGTEGRDQKRGNGGIFMMGCFEIQIHDSWENPTYADGIVGAVYGQTPPLVNAAKKPGQWQSIDIFFNAPQADENGKVTEPARVTVLVNGVLVQNNTPILGPTKNRVATTYENFTVRDGKILFQDHVNNPPLRYRNIWVRPIGESHPLKN